MTLTPSAVTEKSACNLAGQSLRWRDVVRATVLGLVLAGTVATPALAQDAKRGDDGPREEVEPFYGDASQSIAIQVPGFRGIEPNLALRYRSSRRDDLLGVGWTLGGFSTIEAASPRRGVPKYNSNDIFILDGQELVPCEAGMMSPSCATGGTHATKIESYLRIKLDEVANTWEIWNRDGTKITLEPVVGEATTPTPTTTVLLDATFGSDDEGFIYADGLFGGDSPNDYANGSWDDEDAELKLRLGGLDSSRAVDMSGGWTQSFSVPSTMSVSISLAYIMKFPKYYEADEFSQVLMSFDGAPASTLEEFVGGTGVYQSSGWQTHVVNPGTLQAGTYTISFGGYSNKKTYDNEQTRIDFDDVIVTGEVQGSPYTFATTKRWAVAAVADTRGNTVSYSYFNNAGNAYPATVSYNGTEIDFYWEERPDGYSTAIGTNSLIGTGLRLKTVDVQTGGQRVRSYALSYGGALPTTEKALLASVQLYGKDAVLDGTGTVTGGTALPPTSFTYYDDPLTFAASASWSSAHSGTAYKAESVQYADVNGDNLADRIFRTTNNQIHVSLSDGTQFAAPVLWASPGGAYKTDQDSYGDVNGDGMADLVFRKSNNQIGVYLSDGTAFSAPAGWTAMGGGYYAGQVNLGDINGDGKADLVFVKVTSSNTDQTLSTAWKGCEAPFDPTEYLFCPSGFNAIDHWTTGKGCPDGRRLKYHTKCRKTVYSEHLHLAVSNGTDFEAPVQQFTLSSGASSSYHSDRAKLADVNGDGLLDFSYRADGNVVKIALSDGEDFAALNSWHHFSGSYQGGQLQYADVNGDGTADALFHPVSASCSQYTKTAERTGYPACNPGDATLGFRRWSEEVGQEGGSYWVYETTCQHCSVAGSQFVEVALSTGSDFLAPETWFTGIPSNTEPDLIKFADFDGDGRADLTYRNGSNAVTVALSTGKQFTTLTTLPAFNGGYKPDQIQLADVNGDGKDDVIHRATNQTTSVALAGPAGEPSHALKTVTNVYGGVLTYAYTPSSAWTNTNLPFVVNTVSSVTADDGRGQLATTAYSYAGGLWDAPERRFLGFRTATATLPCIDGEATCPTVTTTFLQDYGAHSKPEKVERRDGAGTLLTEVEHEYTLNGAIIPYTSLNTATTRTHHEGAQSRRSKTTRVYDAYANVIESTFHGDFDQPGDELTATRKFFPNTADYIVSLPARLRRYEGTGTVGAMLTESILYYDSTADQTTPPGVGDLTSVSDWDDNTLGYVTSSIEYDGFGNVTAAIDPLGRRTETDYDTTYNLFPIAIRNPLYFGGDTRQMTATTWDEGCGLPLTITDLNGQVTTHLYDALCRGIQTDTPAGNFSITSYPNLGDPLTQYMQRETPPADGSGNIWARSYLDGWGREVQSLAKGPALGQEIAVDSAYNQRGAMASVTRPYYLGDPVHSKNYGYDARNRLTEEQHPDLNSRATAYGIGSAFSSVTATDEVGHSVTTHYDAYGRLVRKEEALGVGTVVETYAWDLLGRLTGITDDAGNAWAYTYDSLGRRLTVDDPDLGAWSYVYDAAGQLTSQTDAKGQTTSFTYDDLGRVLTKTAWNAAAAQNDITTYTYDEDRVGFFNVGQQTTASNAAGQITYDHDTDGRQVKTSYTIDGSSYVFETGLGLAGRVLWQSYPDGDTVGSVGTPITYDAAGRTAMIPGVTSSAGYDARGWVTSVTRANGVSSSYTYSPERGWLEGLQTLSGPMTVQDFTYQRLADGQIDGITSGLFGETWDYGYDDLKRLTTATNTDEPLHSRSYSYDSVGNILTKSDVGTYSYPPPGSPRPHAATAAGGKTYGYDANGNMTQVSDGGGVIRTLTWDGEDRPSAIDGVTFHYGPDGARWKKVDTTTGEITLTLGEIEVQDAGSINEVMVKYLPGGARRSGMTTLWHHKDHLQSVQAVTDDAGTVALRRIHAPFGKRVFDSGSTFVEAKDYIGERLDAETGLLYLNARYYDPVLARFISGDPSGPMGQGVGVNRYAYSGNNPVLYSDPYGLAWREEQTERELGTHHGSSSGSGSASSGSASGGGSIGGRSGFRDVAQVADFRRDKMLTRTPHEPSLGNGFGGGRGFGPAGSGGSVGGSIVGKAVGQLIDSIFGGDVVQNEKKRPDEEGEEKSTETPASDKPTSESGPGNPSAESNTAGEPASGETPLVDHVGIKHPPRDRVLPGFPDAKPVREKTPVKGGGGKRARWKDKKGNIIEWDSRHGTVEKYNKRGKHQGEFDPFTGEKRKDADPSRTVEP